jgi:hypothetical protein
MTTVMRYLELDSLEFADHPDIAAAYATEHREHRRQYPRLVAGTPEQLAAADALVASFRAADDAAGIRTAENIRRIRQRTAVSAVLTDDVVVAFLEGMT